MVRVNRRAEEQTAMDDRLLVEEEEDNGGVNYCDNGDSAVTPLLLFSVFIAVCGSFVYGVAMGYTSQTESAIMEDLDLSTAQFSLFGSLLTVGGFVGNVVSGKITDLIGRRSAMGLSNILNLLGWILISIAQKAWSLDLGRFLVGISTGVITYVVPIYIAEITPKNLRGALISSIQLMMSSGLLITFTIGLVIPWRFLVLLGIVPSVIQLLGVFMIPESPRLLAKLGCKKAYELVLQRLRGSSVDISKESAAIQEIANYLQQIPEVGFWGLFQRQYAHALVVVLVLMTSTGFAGPTAATYYASSIFESAGFSSLIGTVGMAFVQVPSAAIGAYLIDKCGRRPLLMVSAGAMCFFCTLVGSMFLLKDQDCFETIGRYFLVLGLWGFSAAFRIGMSGIPYVFMSEIFAMNVKGAAGTLAVIAGGLATWIITYAFNYMTNWSYAGTFFVIASANALTVLFVAKIVPETKGKTLEEIQESLNHVLH